VIVISYDHVYCNTLGLHQHQKARNHRWIKKPDLMVNIPQLPKLSRQQQSPKLTFFSYPDTVNQFSENRAIILLNSKKGYPPKLFSFSYPKCPVCGRSMQIYKIRRGFIRFRCKSCKTKTNVNRFIPPEPIAPSLLLSLVVLILILSSSYLSLLQTQYVFSCYH